MLVMRNGSIERDRAVHVDATAPLPAAGRVLVSIERWRRERRVSWPAAIRVGVMVAGPGELDELRVDLARLSALAIAIAGGRDLGEVWPDLAAALRGLRTVHGWTGELRAAGDFPIARIPELLRLGFDTIELPTLADARLASAQASGSRGIACALDLSWRMDAIGVGGTAQPWVRRQ